MSKRTPRQHIPRLLQPRSSKSTGIPNSVAGSRRSPSKESSKESSKEQLAISYVKHVASTKQALPIVFVEDSGDEVEVDAEHNIRTTNSHSVDENWFELSCVEPGFCIVSPAPDTHQDNEVSSTPSIYYQVIPGSEDELSDQSPQKNMEHDDLLLLSDSVSTPSTEPLLDQSTKSSDEASDSLAAPRIAEIIQVTTRPISLEPEGIKKPSQHHFSTVRSYLLRERTFQQRKPYTADKQLHARLIGSRRGSSRPFSSTDFIREDALLTDLQDDEEDPDYEEHQSLPINDSSIAMADRPQSRHTGHSRHAEDMDFSLRGLDDDELPTTDELRRRYQIQRQATDTAHDPVSQSLRHMLPPLRLPSALSIRARRKLERLAKQQMEPLESPDAEPLMAPWSRSQSPCHPSSGVMDEDMARLQSDDGPILGAALPPDVTGAGDGNCHFNQISSSDCDEDTTVLARAKKMKKHRQHVLPKAFFKRNLLPDDAAALKALRSSKVLETAARAEPLHVQLAHHAKRRIKRSGQGGGALDEFIAQLAQDKSDSEDGSTRSPSPSSLQDSDDDATRSSDQISRPTLQDTMAASSYSLSSRTNTHHYQRQSSTKDVNSSDQHGSGSDDDNSLDWRRLGSGDFQYDLYGHRVKSYEGDTVNRYEHDYDHDNWADYQRRNSDVGQDSIDNDSASILEIQDSRGQRTGLEYPIRRYDTTTPRYRPRELCHVKIVRRTRAPRPARTHQRSKQYQTTHRKPNAPHQRTLYSHFSSCFSADQAPSLDHISSPPLSIPEAQKTQGPLPTLLERQRKINNASGFKGLMLTDNTIPNGLYFSRETYTGRGMLSRILHAISPHPNEALSIQEHVSQVVFFGQPFTPDWQDVSSIERALGSVLLDFERRFQLIEESQRNHDTGNLRGDTHAPSELAACLLTLENMTLLLIERSATPSRLDFVSFWTTRTAENDVGGEGLSNGIVWQEQGDHILMLLQGMCLLHQFGKDGSSNTAIRTTENWELVIWLIQENWLDRTPPESTMTERQLRKLLVFCYSRTHIWGWTPCADVVIHIYRYFSNRGFQDMPTELGYRLPEFLKRMITILPKNAAQPNAKAADCPMAPTEFQPNMAFAETVDNLLNFEKSDDASRRILLEAAFYLGAVWQRQGGSSGVFSEGGRSPEKIVEYLFGRIEFMCRTFEHDLATMDDMSTVYMPRNKRKAPLSALIEMTLDYIARLLTRLSRFLSPDIAYPPELRLQAIGIVERFLTQRKAHAEHLCNLKTKQIQRNVQTSAEVADRATVGGYTEEITEDGFSLLDYDFIFDDSELMDYPQSSESKILEPSTISFSPENTQPLLGMPVGHPRDIDLVKIILSWLHPSLENLVRTRLQVLHDKQQQQQARSTIATNFAQHENNIASFFTATRGTEGRNSDLSARLSNIASISLQGVWRVLGVHADCSVILVDQDKRKIEDVAALFKHESWLSPWIQHWKLQDELIWATCMIESHPRMLLTYEDMFLDLWFSTISLPVHELTTQHRFLHAILRFSDSIVADTGDQPVLFSRYLFRDLPIAHLDYPGSRAPVPTSYLEEMYVGRSLEATNQDAKLFREFKESRLQLIVKVLSNIGEHCLAVKPAADATDQQVYHQAQAIKSRYQSYLDLLLNQIKKDYERLESKRMVRESIQHVELAHHVVGQVLQHCGLVMQNSQLAGPHDSIMNFLTSSRQFPQPRMDGVYVHQRIRGYAYLYQAGEKLFFHDLLDIVLNRLKLVPGRNALRFKWPIQASDNATQIPVGNGAQMSTGDGDPSFALLELRVIDNGLKIYDSSDNNRVSPAKGSANIQHLFGIQQGRSGIVPGVPNANRVAAIAHGPTDAAKKDSSTKTSIQTLLSNLALKQQDRHHYADEALRTLISSLRNVALETEDRTQWTASVEPHEGFSALKALESFQKETSVLFASILQCLAGCFDLINMRWMDLVRTRLGGTGLQDDETDRILGESMDPSGALYLFGQVLQAIEAIVKVARKIKTEHAYFYF
ncbi:hypothetical protein BGZ65_005279 [Modicella reniformis]|uniref:Mus7/MMS22 family-domain-containing protein n=1 Tax=Modicella reniformis TaxID=1440133 RepID=A0A9P6MLE0_9FUNG|nr:hypothetical protein BGZ65_005279 [Modicella reniformis]